MLIHPPISTDTLALHGAGVRTTADASTAGAVAAEMLLADMIARVDRLQVGAQYLHGAVTEEEGLQVVGPPLL